MKLDLAKAQEIFDKACADDTALPDKIIETTPIPEEIIPPFIPPDPLQEILPTKFPATKAQPLPYSTPDPRYRLSIPKRRHGRRIPRPRRPKHLQLSRRLPKQAQLNPQQLLDRQEKVMELRVNEGLTWEEVGKRIGISARTAWKDSRVIADLKYQGLIEKDKHILMESNQRYDQLMERWLPLAMNTPAVGTEKIKPDGSVYYVELPEWQAAKEAGEMILKICKQREQANGIVDPKGGPTKLGGEEIGDGIATGVMTAIQRWAVAPKLVPATVIESHVISQ